MSLSNIRIELELRDNNFTIKTKRAGKTVRNLGREFDKTQKSLKNIEKGVTGILPKLRDFAITASILKGGIHNLYNATFGWQKSIIDTNASIERMTFLLKGMSQATTESGRLKEATADLEYLFDQAERAPFSLGEMTNSLVKMRSVGLDDARFGLQSLTNAVAQFGGTDETLHRATIAIQQMAGKGVISMEELRQQLGEAVPTAIKLMARSMNLTYQELVDAIATGRVEANDALKRMFSEMDRTMGGAAQNMMDTWVGMVSRLETRWMRFQVMMGDAGMFDAAKDALGKMIDEMDPNKVAQIAQAWGNFLGEATIAIIKLTEYLIEHGDVILTVAANLASLWIGVKVFKGIAAAMGGLTAIKAYEKAQLAAAGATRTSVQSALGMKPAAASATKSFGAMTKAAGAFASALRFLTGPWGIIIGLAATAGASFIDFSNDVDKATEMVRTHSLAMEKESKKTLDRAVTSQKAINDVYKENYLEASQKFDFVSSNGYSEERVEQERENMEAARAQLAEHNEATMRMIMLQGESEAAQIANLTDKKTEALERGLAKQNANLTASYSYDSDRLAKEYEAQEITLQEYTDRKTVIIKTFYDAQLEVMGAQATRIAKEMVGATEANKAALIAELATLKNLDNEVRKRRDDQIQDAAREAKLLDRKSGNTRLENFVTQTGASISKLKADLAEGSTSLAKFKSLLNSGFYGDEGEALLGGGLVGGKTLAEIEALLAKMDEYKDKVKEAKVEERAGESLAKKYRESNQELATAKQLLATGADESFVDRVNRQVDELLLKMPNATQEVKDMAQAIKDQAVSQNALNTAFDLKEDTQKINNDLLKESDRYQKEYEQKLKKAKEVLIGIEKLSASDRAAVQEAYYEHVAALEDELSRKTESETETMLRSWEDSTSAMKAASADWINDATDMLVEFVKTGKLEFGSLVESILSDLLKIQMQENMSGLLGGSGGGSGGSGLAGSIGSLIANNTGSNYAGSGLEQLLFEYLPFANGGIMTKGGSVPLNMYANGGIANSPQMAMFGEGSTPEAYVPLPDGRSIPVTMSGNMGGGAPTSVQVNVINQTQQDVNADQGQTRFDGKKMILDVVMMAAGTPGPFRDSMKGALK